MTVRRLIERLQACGVSLDNEVEVYVDRSSDSIDPLVASINGVSDITNEEGQAVLIWTREKR